MLYNCVHFTFNIILQIKKVMPYSQVILRDWLKGKS